MARMIDESHISPVLRRRRSSGVPGDVHRAILEDDGPLIRVIDTFTCIGGVVLIPWAGDGLGKVDHCVLSDVQCAVGAIAGDGELRVGAKDASEEGSGEDEWVVFHGFSGLLGWKFGTAVCG